MFFSKYVVGLFSLIVFFISQVSWADRGIIDLVPPGKTVKISDLENKYPRYRYNRPSTVEVQNWLSDLAREECRSHPTHTQWVWLKTNIDIPPKSKNKIRIPEVPVFNHIWCVNPKKVTINNHPNYYDRVWSRIEFIEKNAEVFPNVLLETLIAEEGRKVQSSRDLTRMIEFRSCIEKVAASFAKRKIQLTSMLQHYVVPRSAQSLLQEAVAIKKAASASKSFNGTEFILGKVRDYLDLLSVPFLESRPESNQVFEYIELYEGKLQSTSPLLSLANTQASKFDHFKILTPYFMKEAEFRQKILALSPGVSAEQILELWEVGEVDEVLVEFYQKNPSVETLRKFTLNSKGFEAWHRNHTQKDSGSSQKSVNSSVNQALVSTVLPKVSEKTVQAVISPREMTDEEKITAIATVESFFSLLDEFVRVDYFTRESKLNNSTRPLFVDKLLKLNTSLDHFKLLIEQIRLQVGQLDSELEARLADAILRSAFSVSDRSEKIQAVLEALKLIETTEVSKNSKGYIIYQNILSSNSLKTLILHLSREELSPNEASQILHYLIRIIDAEQFAQFLNSISLKKVNSDSHLVVQLKATFSRILRKSFGLSIRQGYHELNDALFRHFSELFEKDPTVFSAADLVLLAQHDLKSPLNERFLQAAQEKFPSTLNGIKQVLKVMDYSYSSDTDGKFRFFDLQLLNHTLEVIYQERLKLRQLEQKRALFQEAKVLLVLFYTNTDLGPSECSSLAKLLREKAVYSAEDYLLWAEPMSSYSKYQKNDELKKDLSYESQRTFDSCLEKQVEKSIDQFMSYDPAPTPEQKKQLSEWYWNSDSLKPDVMDYFYRHK